MSVPPLALVDQQVISIRDMPDLLTKVEAVVRRGAGFTLYTLNLDHLVKRRQSDTFRRLYKRATFVTADGWPVVSLARRICPSMKRTTGADLVVPLCRLAARTQLPIALFGTTESVLTAAAANLRAVCPGLEIAYCEAPPSGFDPLGGLSDQGIARVAESGARICFVALGAPKQEIFSDRAFAAHPHMSFVCVGAALDFIAGTHRRAPALVRKVRLEWAWRLVQQPKRLSSRYVRCALLFARLAPGLLRVDLRRAS